MSVRILPNNLIDQIAAGEVVERPASVVKELIENALDAGADQIVIDVADGGRTLINIVDNGGGMSRDDLQKCIQRHATSKLPDDDLLAINSMGFRGEALPSIASVGDMTIDTNGMQLDCSTGEIKPSAWEGGTRVRVENLFSKTPARLKFLRTDRAEMMSVVEVVKKLALARPDVGFILNNKWRYPKGRPIMDRIVAVMGDDACERMLNVECRVLNDGENNIKNSTLKLTGFISEPTLRRASSIDQYLFVNGRPVKDKVLVGALRAAYMDVMSAREFPLCVLYLEVPPREVDVNVSPAKTEVHFLEPSRVRAFIIKTLRDALAVPMARNAEHRERLWQQPTEQSFNSNNDILKVCEQAIGIRYSDPAFGQGPDSEYRIPYPDADEQPLGRVIGQVGNKYIIAESAKGMVVVDQHAAHERIVYEKLKNREIKTQPLLSPIVVKLKPEEVQALETIGAELSASGLKVSEFGPDAVAIYEKPADWDMDWAALFRDIASEVLSHGHSSKLSEKLHLKLANHACHYSVRAGQKLDLCSMDALLRDIEKTERAGSCNHGRPVYKIIQISEIDSWFERL
ncbi:MAG: DNA mismatch repair endonuclease MutL [Alphaproteobacteria bacterium]|nr:DNA mismatch repair endonuclease MutL [Alphaproteobacteria bacterium]